MHSSHAAASGRVHSWCPPALVTCACYADGRPPLAPACLVQAGIDTLLLLAPWMLCFSLT